MKPAYYNEIDPFAAQMLRNLITAGHIAPGDVDERSIEDVHPSDLKPYAQCHFFAGVGVWSYALRRAGWADDRPVWTGSCPCQPFSSAGQGVGFDDERHLWPHFFHLIGKRRPPTIFGEQVASRDANPWIDLVQDDLEGLGYGVGAVPFPSASVGAPQLRDRLYWMAHANDAGLQRLWGFERVNGAQRRKATQRHIAKSTLASPYRGWKTERGADGILRSVPPDFSQASDATSERVGRLRAYGNAINAEQARVFIEAGMSCMP